MIFFPESPRHLIATDREDEAMKILRKLHFNGHNDAWIQAEFDEIRTTIAAEKAITVPGWMVMFTVPQWRRRLLLGTAVQVFTQMTGISKFSWDGNWDWEESSMLILDQMSLATTRSSCMKLSASQVGKLFWFQESTIASVHLQVCCPQTS